MNLLPSILAGVDFLAALSPGAIADMMGEDDMGGGRRMDWVLLACLLASIGIGGCVYLMFAGVNENARAGITLAVGLVTFYCLGLFAENRAIWQPRMPKADPSALRERPIDINTARRSQLETVPGIGPVTATRIMDGRPWSNVDHLQHIRGVKRDNFRAMRPYLTVASATPPPVQAEPATPVPWQEMRQALIEADQRRRLDAAASQ